MFITIKPKLTFPRHLVILVFALLAAVCCSVTVLAAPTSTDDPGSLDTPVPFAQMLQMIDTNREFACWRKRAENILARNSKDFSGNFLMGWVMHRSEGDLPRARYYLDKAHKQSLDRAQNSGSNESIGYLTLSLYELSQVLGEMDLYQAKLDLLKEFIRINDNPLLKVEQVWPLMKLDREAQAREVLSEAFASDDPTTRIVAWNSLGALEAELGNYEESYNAFNSLVKESEMLGREIDGTYYRNIGEVALSLCRYDDAERNMREAAKHFSEVTYTNPYQDLAKLYIEECRFPEAVDAAQRMVQWSMAVRPFLYQQSMSENIQITGDLLLALGYADEAVERLQRLVQRPDRRGGTSIDKDQSEAGNLLSWHIALVNQREYVSEQMAYSRGLDWWRLLAKRISLYTPIKTSAEKTAALCVGNNRLACSLLPHGSGAIDTTEWFRPSIVSVVGPGICAAQIEQTAANPPNHYSLYEPFVTVLRAQVAAETGHRRLALQYIDKALNTLPKAEKMLMARSRALAGRLNEESGNRALALAHYQAALQSGPAMIRLVGGEIPITVYADDNQTSRLVSHMLDKSPRFKVTANGLPMHLGLSGKQLKASLLGTDGTVLARASTDLQTDAFASASGLARDIHTQVLSPKISLSKIDMNSLDGSNSAGSTASESAKELFNFEDSSDARI